MILESLCVIIGPCTEIDNPFSSEIPEGPRPPPECLMTFVLHPLSFSFLFGAFYNLWRLLIFNLFSLPLVDSYTNLYTSCVFFWFLHTGCLRPAYFIHKGAWEFRRREGSLQASAMRADIGPRFHSSTAATSMSFINQDSSTTYMPKLYSKNGQDATDS